MLIKKTLFILSLLLLVANPASADIQPGAEEVAPAVSEYYISSGESVRAAEGDVVRVTDNIKIKILEDNELGDCVFLIDYNGQNDYREDFKIAVPRGQANDYDYIVEGKKITLTCH